jgi:PKD repeat protein
MAEERATSLIPGWVKAIGSSVFGLIGGAALMYLTPLVNNAVKPAEPVANFGYQAQGLAVTFQNRASNATDGWWDFGDGSALEPFVPNQPTIAHSYTKPGPYSVKLNLTNLFNEKSERTVTINLEAGAAPAPVVEQFDVAPLSPGMTNPAVYRLVAKVKNADQLIWCYGDCKPFEVSTETGGVLEKWVTLDDPGYHTFRVVAVSGKYTVEKAAQPVWVDAAPSANAPIATLTVVYEAVHVERQENVAADVRLPWKLDCRDNLCTVAVDWLPKPGFQVAKAELNGTGKDARVRGVPRVDIAPDHSKVVVTADLMRPSGLLSHMIPAPHHVPIKVTLEKRSAATTKAFEVPACLKVPGQTVIPIPPMSGYWQATKRQVTLDVKEGARKIWSGSDMPVNRPLQLQGHPVVVNAAVQNNQVVLTVTNPQVGLVPQGN